MERTRTLLVALYRVYEDSGFTMAGAVAFAMLVALFPFCIFVGAIAGVFGGRELAAVAVTHLFDTFPPAVAEALAPQVKAIMGQTRIDLLTFGGFLALFFATNALETLRAALNGAYRVQEDRPYVVCLGLSMSLVIMTAVSMLVLSWVMIVAPLLAAQYETNLTRQVTESSWWQLIWKYGLAGLVLFVQLTVMHLWLAAGRRRIQDVWPGILFSVALWLTVAAFYSLYLGVSNYSRFYAGLSQLMIALIFFQFTALIIILGAELNRGIMELKRMKNGAKHTLSQPETV